MARRTNPRRLLVEGRDEQRLIPELMERNGVPWGQKADEAIVYIEEFDGVENLLKPGVIEAELKASSLKQLGIVVDADGDSNARWRSIRARCGSVFPNLPEDLPLEGLVVINDKGISLGVWIMPDNQSSGMLETFLNFLLQDPADKLYEHAVESVAQAKRIGAPFITVHECKAQIHTWLAWQNPPGRQMHQAVSERILDAQSPRAQPFVNWFRKLYGL